MRKYILLSRLLLIVTPLIWMNITPGYFQSDKRWCCPSCEVVYIGDEENINVGCERIMCLQVMCEETVVDRLKLFTSNFDFYK